MSQAGIGTTCRADDDRPGSGASVRILRAEGPLLPRAAGRLTAASAAGDDNGRQFLSATRAHNISLRHFWLALHQDPSQGEARVGEVALAVPGAGRTAVLFCSLPNDIAGEAELSRVIERVAEDLPDTRIVQALLTEHESAISRGCVMAGFEEIAWLAYMRRPTPRSGQFREPAGSAWPAEVAVEPATSASESELMEALERSYVGTLDCPRLCGLRDTVDVLASHRSTGRYDVRWWWIIRHAGQPRGVMLFNPCPEQNSVELVYVGVSPELRGLGLGRLLMDLALSRLPERSESSISCAVDLANAPARRLYERYGFVEFGRRRALIRPLPA